MNDRLLTLEKRIEDQQRLLGTATASASRALEQANLHEQRHQHSQHTIAELQKQNAQLTERLSRVVMRMKEQDVAHEQHQRQLDDLAAQLDNVNLGGSASGDEADEEDVSGARPAKRRKVTKGKAGSRATQTEGPQEKGGKARKTAAQKALAKCARAALAASRGVTEKESARDTLQAYDPDDPTSINFDCPLTHASNLTPLEAARTWARTNIDRFANLAKSDLADLDTALNTAFESLRQRWRSQGKAPEVLTARAQHDRHLAARKRKAQRRQRVFLEKIDKQAHKYQNRPWAHWLDRDVWHINEIADFFVPGAMSSEVTTVEATAPEDEGDASDAGKTKKKKFSVRPLSFRNPTMTDLFLDCDSVGQKDSPQRTLHPGSPKTSVPPDLGWEHIKLSVAAAMLRSGVPGERHLRACCCATGKRMTLEQTYPDGILEAFEAAVQTNAEIAKARLAEEGRAGGTLGEEEQEEEADGDGRGGAPDARGESGPLDSSAAGAGGAAAAGMYNETTMDGEDGGSEASFAMSDREGGGEGGGWFGAEVGGSAAPDLAIDPSLITLGADVSSGTTQVGGQWCPDDADMSEDDLYS
ncbi:hypothetical protein Rhopal_000821-T1 [Rhodotorula paludigena]|uniref:Uncharacterized protein n=1 Tax=Rhodotorula paludigena TaxID=86838 RepID=A0AAV5GE16_9BASI|nr:hypothetical protein Rhopal_000821-T1 [Rhodotorula paludigena]